MARLLMRFSTFAVPVLSAAALDIVMPIKLAAFRELSVQVFTLATGIVIGLVGLWLTSPPGSRPVRPEQAARVLEVPLLAVIPVMSTPAELSAKYQQRRIVVVSVAGAALAAIAWWLLRR